MYIYIKVRKYARGRPFHIFGRNNFTVEITAFFDNLFFQAQRFIIYHTYVGCNMPLRFIHLRLC